MKINDLKPEMYINSIDHNYFWFLKIISIADDHYGNIIADVVSKSNFGKNDVRLSSNTQVKISEISRVIAGYNETNRDDMIKMIKIMFS